MIVEKLPLPPVYYHGREASFWREDDKGGWIKINESSAKNFVASHGYAKKSATAEPNCEADDCIMKIQESQNVAYVGTLAGHASGVYETAGNLVLVTSSPKFIESKAGEWSTLARLFEGMFMYDGMDQRPYFYGWVKSAMASLRACHWRASQMLALAGEAGSGKSLTQNLITEMFGGRSRKPYRVMTGATTFNSELFGGEHLVLEDESASVDIRSRTNFAANIKSMLAGWNQSCHAKHSEAITLRPIWRMTLTLNVEPEHLLVLPPFRSDVRDKIIALRVNKSPMPMPTGTPELEKLFWNTLVSELPAFLHHLENWTIPADVADSRYGVRAFQHPEIIEKLDETAPEMRLLEMIDERISFGNFCREWNGTATDLTRHLTRESSGCRDEAKRMFNWSGACGSYLSRLENATAPHVAGRISSRRVNGIRRWTILPRPNGNPHEEILEE
jgi:hypothetical protein